MSNSVHNRLPIWALAKKEVYESVHNRFLLIVTIVMCIASAVALTTAAIALNADVMAFEQAKAVLLSMGKSIEMINQPSFNVLHLLRGFIEHIEILGAVLGILMGYQSAAVERTHKTLPLILSRPISYRHFLQGKVLGAFINLSVGLALIFVLIGLAINGLSNVHLSLDTWSRLGLVYVSAVFYSLCFYLIGFILALKMKKLPNALLSAFSLWLVLILVAPQIGDTLDPDNQVAGGVFKQLHIAKPQQIEILKSFSTYETIRTGIEAASPAKHFERLSFALFGIKDIYNGMAIEPILKDRINDILWLTGLLTALFIGLMNIRLNITLLTKE